MQHVLQLKSAQGRSKGLGRSMGLGTWGVFAMLFLGCAHPPQAEGSPANAPDAGDKIGPAKSSSSQADAAPKTEPATSENDSAQSNRPSLATAPVSKELPPSFDCSGLTCYKFETSRQALVPLILHHKARAIGFGEAHATKDFKGASTVHRFTHDLLPTLADGTSHLLLELLNPPKEGCKEEKAAVQRESDQVTAGQSQGNQNEYLKLGTQARELGVAPDILWSTCEDLAFIASPQGGVVAMMETIAELSKKALSEQLKSTRKGRPLVLAYGGALHNDVTPREGRESWSYGPALMNDTKGHYLEVDLMVPELIGNSESWTSFPWYAAYQALGHKEGAILMKWGDHSYTLFLEPGR